MTRNVLVVVLIFLVSACTKEPAKVSSNVSSNQTEWDLIATLPSGVYAFAVGSSNICILAGGTAFDTLVFYSLDQNGKVVESRPVALNKSIPYLTKDFYVTFTFQGDAAYSNDSTLINFYSTATNATKPIAILDARDFRTTNVAKANTWTNLQFSASSLNDNTYGVILRYGPDSEIHVDVASFQVSNSQVNITNKTQIRIYPMISSTPALWQDLLIAVKDKFIVKLEEGMYQYVPNVSLTSLSNLPTNYMESEASEFVKSDTIFMTTVPNAQLYYANDLTKPWSILSFSQTTPLLGLNNYVVCYGVYPNSISTFTIAIYKANYSNSQVELYKG
jgi:hypothetical protein